MHHRALVFEHPPQVPCRRELNSVTAGIIITYVFLILGWLIWSVVYMQQSLPFSAYCLKSFNHCAESHGNYCNQDIKHCQQIPLTPLQSPVPSPQEHILLVPLMVQPEKAEAEEQEVQEWLPGWENLAVCPSSYCPGGGHWQECQVGQSTAPVTLGLLIFPQWLPLPNPASGSRYKGPCRGFKGVLERKQASWALDKN